MSVRRHSAHSVRLLDGRVLVAGGIVAGDPANQSMAAGTEIFDPASNTWSVAGSLAHPRYGHALVLLRDGNVLAVGGAHTYGTWDRNSFPHEMELYDPAANQWSMIGEIPFPRFNAVAILLPNGRVWLTGGQFLDNYLADTWIIDVE
jgi:N-acetylneuraminic acid mutarotase